jgi:hypothetical protein
MYIFISIIVYHGTAKIRFSGHDRMIVGFTTICNLCLSPLSLKPAIDYPLNKKEFDNNYSIISYAEW